ncbi:MAG: pseudouridine synthase [Candidatus Woesearchaeota archaeon]
MHRVQKLLSNWGYCSRRSAEDIIAQGRVSVNGKIISLGDQATEQDDIRIDGKRVRQERKIYIAFHKPIGCVTAVTDKHEKTVIDYIRIKERIFPVGRLDKNTSGLLILTNDGDFANQIMHPSNEIKKTYFVKLGWAIAPSDIRRLREGIQLEDGLTRPALVRIHDPDFIEITIHEGKNRIVRRMIEALGHKVIALQRTRIGRIDLGTLRPGRYRHLPVPYGKDSPIV